MLRQPRLVYRVALPLLVVLFGLSTIGKDRTPSEGGSYWVGALSWAAFAIVLLALVVFSLVLLVTRRRMTGREGAAVVVLAAGAVLGVVPGTVTAEAAVERMRLECDNGLILERSNGSSWWGLDEDGSHDGSVYVTRHLEVVDTDGSVVYEHRYGNKSDRLDSTTCVASHFGWTWTLEVVTTR